jgi:hypothetical protein
LEERSNEKGKLAEAPEEGQGPRRAVESMVMMMMKVEMLVFWVVIPCSPSSFFDRKGGDSRLI